jgi:hypothetical protein
MLREFRPGGWNEVVGPFQVRIVAPNQIGHRVYSTKPRWAAQISGAKVSGFGEPLALVVFVSAISQCRAALFD